jgi:protein-disulfide isomerase
MHISPVYYFFMEPNVQTETTTTEQMPLSSPTPTSGRNSILIPLAILAGFGMVAGAIFFGGGGAAPYVVQTDEAENRVQPQDNGDPENVTPVTAEDWIRGNPNAPIQIVEYSDYDCPFCKNFHETMNQIMAEYGTSGQVSWVYRHFPLAQLHPNAPRIALAAECVGHLGGNEAFWEFSDLVFDERGTNEPTNITRLEESAVTSGVDAAAFNNCVDNEEYMADVQADFENAVAVGGRGTPHSIIIVGNQTGVINGAQPYSAVKQNIDNLLAQLNGTAN